MKNKNRSLGALLLVSALISNQALPVMAWKITVPGVINTGVQIYQQTHKKSDGRVKTPEHFNPAGIRVKSERDLDVPLPAGDYFILLKPRSDIRLQPQETPWFRVNKKTVAHIIVQSSGVRRIEFRIEGKAYSYLHKGFYLAQAARKFPVPRIPFPANDNEIVPSEEIPVSAGAGVSLRAIFSGIAASAIGSAIFVGTTVAAILLPNSTASDDTLSASENQPRQNRRPGEYPCEDEKLPDSPLPDLVRQTAEENELWHIAIDPPVTGIGKPSYIYRNVTDPAVLARFTRLYGGVHWEEHRVPKTFLANGKKVFLRWFRPQGSVNEYDFQFVSECHEKKHLPVLVIDSNVMPNIAKHIREAQAQGQPKVLTYLGPNHPTRDQNRKAACPKSAQKPNSCDEYPFATTVEGGSGASTATVPLSENLAQGVQLSAFYRKKLNSEAGRKFLVIVK